MKNLLGLDTTGILPMIAGAFIRGLVGPGPWVWREFFFSLVVGVSFLFWILPVVSTHYELSSAQSNGLALGMGMTALPIARGFIGLARAFAKDPVKFIKRK